MKLNIETTSFSLHIMAMLFMLMDHMWATIFMQHEFLTCIGRIAYPIFAFMIVEGYHHTHDIKKYMQRLFIAAVISEVPFNLMVAGTAIYPFHQNVMWTFLLAILLIQLIEKLTKKTENRFLKIVICLGITLLGYIAGFVSMVDYFGNGILIVLIFYFFKGNKWWNYLLQFAGMYMINCVMLAGYYYPVYIFGHYFEIYQQAFAMLALIPIWLYRGKQGYHSKGFQYFCYLFYPLHMLVLYLLMI